MTCDEIVLLETPGPSSDILQAERECSSSRMKSLVGDLNSAAQQVGLPQEFIHNIPQHISAGSISLQHSDGLTNTTRRAHGDSITLFSPS